MAIANLLKQGTYSTLSVTGYDKSSRTVSAILTVKDGDEVLSMSNLTIGAAPVEKTVEELDRDSIIDPETQHSKWFALQPGVVSEGPSFIYHSEGAQGPVMAPISEGCLVELASSGDIYQYTGGAWVKNDKVLTEARWDAMFGIEATSADGENILKKLYEFLASEWQLASGDNV